MTIDWSRLKTAEDSAAEAAAERLGRAKLECRRRILAVANEPAQMNLAAAAAAQLLSAPEMATYVTGLGWVAAMRASCAAAAEADDPAADAHWPSIPAGVVDLARRF